MARTKASVGAKVASGKSSKARSVAPPPPLSKPKSGGSEKSSRSYSGGNPVCPRETPKWQKPITNFLMIEGTKKADKSCDDDGSQGPSVNTSVKKTKSNVIESDEDDVDVDKPKKPVEGSKSMNSSYGLLDESIELQPLTGEDSHKLEEYFSQKEDKKKGKGKKSGKENGDTNSRKNSLKRDLEHSDTEENLNKKVKL